MIESETLETPKTSLPTEESTKEDQDMELENVSKYNFDGIYWNLHVISQKVHSVGMKVVLSSKVDSPSWIFFSLSSK